MKKLYIAKTKGNGAEYATLSIELATLFYVLTEEKPLRVDCLEDYNDLAKISEEPIEEVMRASESCYTIPEEGRGGVFVIEMELGEGQWIYATQNQQILGFLLTAAKSQNAKVEANFIPCVNSLDDFHKSLNGKGYGPIAFTTMNVSKTPQA